MDKTKKPTAAGVLNIIGGAFSIIGGLGSLVGFSVIGGAWGIPGMGAIPGFAPGVLLGSGIFSLIVGVLALIGGIFAVQRKRWGWSLTGSIADIFAFFPLGVIATILIAISKNEFE